MAGVEREHEAVEEAAPVARAAGEQAVHRRGQPQHRQPLAERVDRGRGAVDPHLAALGRGRQRAGADVAVAEPGGDGEAAIGALPRHLGQRRPAQPAPGGEQRHGLEQIGLAGAILAGKEDEARPGLDRGRGIGAEVGQGQASERHLCETLPAGVE